MVDEAAVKALKVSEGFDASKNVEVQKPFAVSENVGVAEYSDDDEHGGNCGSVESGWSWAFLERW